MKEYRVYTDYSNELRPSNPSSDWFASRAEADRCMAELTAKGYTMHMSKRDVEEDESEDDDNA